MHNLRQFDKLFLKSLNLGLGISETAYQTALSYAKERKQGKSNENKNGDTDLIIQHADIRRSLMNMKSIIEGERALSFWMAQQIDVSLNHNDQNLSLIHI